MIRCNQFTNEALAQPASWTKGRRITFSALTQCRLESREEETYSVKYVLQGTEHYFIEGKNYSVRAGEYLVVNNRVPVDALIRSKEPVLGLCIHLDAQQVREAFAAAVLPASVLLETQQATAALPEVRSLIYSSNENALGQYVKQATQNFNGTTATVPVHEEDFFQTLSDHFVRLQNQWDAGRSLSVRNSVEQELAARLRKAKDLLDDAGPEDVNVDALAREALLSTSHFFRLFRKAYGVSPYQYLLRRKLAGAHASLVSRQLTVTGAALQFGFADTAAFSKAYKKLYGVSPARAIN